MDAHAALHPTDQTLGSHGLGKLDDRSADSVNKHLEHLAEGRLPSGKDKRDLSIHEIRGL